MLVDYSSRRQARSKVRFQKGDRSGKAYLPPGTQAYQGTHCAWGWDTLSISLSSLGSKKMLRGSKNCLFHTHRTLMCKRGAMLKTRGQVPPRTLESQLPAC